MNEDRKSKSTESKGTKSKAKWFSPRSGLIVIAVFGLVAAIPYLSTAVKLMAADEPVDLKKIAEKTQKEMEKKHEGHEKEKETEKYQELKAAVIAPDGTEYYGTKGGLAIRKSGEWRMETAVTGDVKAMALDSAGKVWVAGKEGLYHQAADGWEKAYDGELHAFALSEGLIVIATKKDGVMKKSGDGEWEAVAELLPEELVTSTPEKH